MRRVGLVLGVCVLMLGALVPAFAQQAFSDVPLDHWAYNAVNKLAETGLIEGYPDGTFKGKRPLTRYEFAQALARLMERVEQIKGTPGPQGPQGPAGPAAAGGGLTAEQQALLDRLAKEFAPELKALRSDLDNLTKRVEELEAREMPKGPVVTVRGKIGVRAGLYGTSLGFGDQKTTGYPFFGDLASAGNDILGSPATATGGAFINEVAPYGGINLPDFDPSTGLWGDQFGFPGGPTFIATIPISDALKDSFKASRFLHQRTQLFLDAQINDKTAAMVELRAGPLTNNPRDTSIDELVDSPNQFAGNGVMDTVAINQAWFSYKTHLLVPMDLVAGKQYVKRAQGLLIDNDQEATKGLRLDWNKDKRTSWGLYWAMLDREEFFGRSNGPLGLPKLVAASSIYGALGLYTSEIAPKTNGQDVYGLYYADFAIGKNWDIGVNWLQSGFAKEQGWSASLNGKFHGLGVYGEFAQLRKWPTGTRFFDADQDGIQNFDELGISDVGRNAWLAGLNWAPPQGWIDLVGEYGQIDPGYAFSPGGAGWSPIGPFGGGSDFFTFNLPLSALHPLAEVDPYDINWVDRQLFLDPTNIAKGWHVAAKFPKLLGKETGLAVSYANGKAVNPQFLSWVAFGGFSGDLTPIAKPGKWVDADPVWTVQLTHQLSSNVTAKLLYGRRNADKVLSKQQVPIVLNLAGQNVSFVAINDAVQVVRAELGVEF